MPCRALPYRYSHVNMAITMDNKHEPVPVPEVAMPFAVAVDDRDRAHSTWYAK